MKKLVKGDQKVTVTHAFTKGSLLGGRSQWVIYKGAVKAENSMT